MKKRLRSEIYHSFVKMGQAGIQVDPKAYQLVRSHLRSEALCGRYTVLAPAELPPPPEKPAKQGRRTRTTQERLKVECILAEEPPSRSVWHRYLVRWVGYKPEWEAWRIPGRGTPGSGPIDTWEKATTVHKYYKTAVEQWRSTQA